MSAPTWQTHPAAVLDAATGSCLAGAEFAATTAGYRQLGEFLTAHGQVLRVGVEGTNSYGAGLTRHLRRDGIEIVEVIRPNRAERRRGKSDPLDAITAARNTLARNDLPMPKIGEGSVECLRVLHIARDSAVKAHTKTIQQIKSILVSAPEQLREHLNQLTDPCAVLHTAYRCAQPGNESCYTHDGVHTTHFGATTSSPRNRNRVHNNRTRRLHRASNACTRACTWYRHRHRGATVDHRGRQP
ncbi:UNVERIFIED_CONTAM: transposase [Williamsia faeni]